MNDYPMPSEWFLRTLRQGAVIPAHPLAVDADRRFDERRQAALTRYYHAAGAGGLAVGVHTTQFEIREPRYGLLEPVLKLAADTVADLDAGTGRRTMLIAGICGETPQAVAEAGLARQLGYHAGLLSLGALPGSSEEDLLTHCRSVAGELPIVGFYLQQAVGGRYLSGRFWRNLALIPNLVAVKIAPFNRYRTLDVVRGITESGRGETVALYTGNDDNIVVDLLTEYRIPTGNGEVRMRIVGGLLGHWACWTRSAVRMLERVRSIRAGSEIPAELLTLAASVTDANAAFFDPENGFAGSRAGIHEVLRRQGLLANNYCLDPAEVLSPGQQEQIERVCRIYPELADDAFVQEHLDEWLR